ncbi:MAG: acyl-CoA thioesterase [Betaproteobacteria bacterium]|nr:acyl-CoA thioesterase [Betaproteobacteria bacterium]
MAGERKLAHVERIPIRWGDMDAMGHVNNTVYFRYMEQARISWFEALIPEAEAWKYTGIVIVNASCHYRRPMTYPGTVEVRLYVGPPGGSSVGTFYELRVDEDPQPYATGEAVVVFVSMASQKPVKIPDGIRTRIEKAETA